MFNSRFLKRSACRVGLNNGEAKSDLFAKRATLRPQYRSLEATQVNAQATAAERTLETATPLAVGASVTESSIPPAAGTLIIAAVQKIPEVSERMAATASTDAETISAVEGTPTAARTPASAGKKRGKRRKNSARSRSRRRPSASRRHMTGQCETDDASAAAEAPKISPCCSTGMRVALAAREPTGNLQHVWVRRTGAKVAAGYMTRFPMPSKQPLAATRGS